VINVTRMTDFQDSNLDEPNSLHADCVVPDDGGTMKCIQHIIKYWNHYNGVGCV
jgi:hypothetical protein